MFRILILCIAIFALARENPFTPIIKPESSIRPFYGESETFSYMDFYFPDSARLIKKIEITFQNLDGSIETQSIITSGQIDPKKPLIITHKHNKAILKNDKKPEIAQNSSKDSTKIQHIEENKPKTQHKFTPYKINDKDIFIAYEGILKRHFMMNNPKRIVLDWNINKKYYQNKPLVLNSPHFKRLKYGIHDSFLRIVLELNGSYVYTLKNEKNGVIISVQ